MTMASFGMPARISRRNWWRLKVDQADIAPAGQTQAQPVTLLCVDDEANILSALKRLFRPRGYRVLTAPSGEQGLKLLGETEVDLVISDMRMPEMDGARFHGVDFGKDIGRQALDAVEFAVVHGSTR